MYARWKRMLIFVGIAVLILFLTLFPDLLSAQMPLTESESIHTISYQYDSAGRLLKVIYRDDLQILYTYDSAGNLLERKITRGTTNVQNWQSH